MLNVNFVTVLERLNHSNTLQYSSVKTNSVKTMANNNSMEEIEILTEKLALLTELVKIQNNRIETLEKFLNARYANALYEFTNKGT